jgi:hypothetical protein
MSYPAISRTDAKRILTSFRQGEDVTHIPTINRQLGSDQDWDEIADKLFLNLDGIRETLLEPGAADLRKFDILAGIEAHKLIPSHPAMADREFWTWLVIRNFIPLVVWRYGEAADAANFGLGGAVENYLFRLWLRADISYDSQDQSYELAHYGDIDLWRSHIFRQSYGDSRAFARALIKFQYPDGPDGKARLKTQQIRDFAKHLKKARSNLTVEVLSEAKSTQLIEREWTKLVEAAL